MHFTYSKSTKQSSNQLLYSGKRWLLRQLTVSTFYQGTLTVGCQNTLFQMSLESYYSLTPSFLHSTHAVVTKQGFTLDTYLKSFSTPASWWGWRPSICAWHWISSSSPQSLDDEPCWQHALFAENEQKKLNVVFRPQNQSSSKGTTTLTQIQGCFKASSERILLAGLTVNIWLIKFLASGVTVSHSGDGYW